MKVKRFLDAILQEELAPIRARRHEYEKDIPAVYDMLKRGSETAREAAAATLDRVRHAMRIDYFADEQLINAQAQAYNRKQV